LGAIPVAFYAGDFLLVNVTYLLLCMEAVDRSAAHKVEPRARSMMRMRSLATLVGFAAAGVVALRYPIGGMAMICLCLILYLSPAAPYSGRSMEPACRRKPLSHSGRLYRPGTSWRSRIA
jgi:hypothetical protein